MNCRRITAKLTLNPFGGDENHAPGLLEMPVSIRAKLKYVHLLRGT